MSTTKISCATIVGDKLEIELRNIPGKRSSKWQTKPKKVYPDHGPPGEISLSGLKYIKTYPKHCPNLPYPSL